MPKVRSNWNMLHYHRCPMCRHPLYLMREDVMVYCCSNRDEECEFIIRADRIEELTKKMRLQIR